MRRMSRPEILMELSSKWAEIGKRHLYLVTGSYDQLRTFEKDLANAKTPDRQPIGQPIGINARIMENLPDEVLDDLVAGEAKYPTVTFNKFTEVFKKILSEAFAKRNVVILKDLELLFAIQIDLSELRLRATNGKHILLMIPGHKIGEKIVLFHEAEENFQRVLPTNLVMDNHIWEIGHDD